MPSLFGGGKYFTICKTRTGPARTMAENYCNCVQELPREMIELVKDAPAGNGLFKLLENILIASREIGNGLRSCGFSSNAIGTVNEFGDAQLDVDVKADAVLFAAMQRSGMVAVASSEEMPHEVSCRGKGYSVAFDPLDGSSVIDANFAVGTIVGIWPGDTLFNRTGREQVCSLVVQYGPRVTAAIAFNAEITANGEPISFEITMLTTGWVVSKPRLCIASVATTFAPGNLRATLDNPQYKSLVNHWIEKQFTLRYSGGLVPDIYHILLKGQGVLCNASSVTAKAKLRLLYECAPIALIIEAAGGATCVCPSEAAEPMDPTSILDVPIDHLDRRVGVCFGSLDEVERFRQCIFNF